MLGPMMPLLGAWLLAGAEVRWTAPAECPTEQRVRDRIDDLAGEGALRPDMVADARVRASPSGWSLRLVLRTAGQSSARQMVSGDCETLADAVALVVATHVDPIPVDQWITRRESSASAPSRPEVAPRSPPELASESASDPPEAAASPAPSSGAPPERAAAREPDRMGVRVAVLAGRAVLDDLDLGPDVELSWQRGVVHLAFGALALVPRDRPVFAGAFLRQWMIAGRLRAGVAMPLSSRVELPLSIGAEIGPVFARGRGVDRPRTAVSPWLAAVGSAHVVWRPRARWGLWIGVEGVLGILLPQFTVDGVGPVVAGPGGLRAMLGVQWRWPAVRG